MSFYQHSKEHRDTTVDSTESALKCWPGSSAQTSSYAGLAAWSRPEHQVGSLPGWWVCAKSRLAAGWGPCSQLSSSLQPLAPSSASRGELEVPRLLRLCRASGLEMSCCCCCFPTDRGNSRCPETVVCPLLLKILGNTAIITACTWETYGFTVLTFSRRRGDAIFSETPCIRTLYSFKTYLCNRPCCVQLLFPGCWNVEIAHAQTEDDKGHRMKLNRGSSSWTPGKTSCQWKVFCQPPQGNSGSSIRQSI